MFEGTHRFDDRDPAGDGRSSRNSAIEGRFGLERLFDAPRHGQDLGLAGVGRETIWRRLGEWMPQDLWKISLPCVVANLWDVQSSALRAEGPIHHSKTDHRTESIHMTDRRSISAFEHGGRAGRIVFNELAVIRKGGDRRAERWGNRSRNMERLADRLDGAQRFGSLGFGQSPCFAQSHSKSKAIAHLPGDQPCLPDRSAVLRRPVRLVRCLQSGCAGGQCFRRSVRHAELSRHEAGPQRPIKELLRASFYQEERQRDRPDNGHKQNQPSKARPECCQRHVQAFKKRCCSMIRLDPGRDGLRPTRRTPGFLGYLPTVGVR